MRADAVQDRSSLDLAGPTEEAWHAPRAFPVGVLLAAEGRIGAIRPSVIFRAVISGIHDDRVVGDAQLVHLIEHHADLLVVSDHPIAVVVLAALSTVLGGEVSPEVHRR